MSMHESFNRSVLSRFLNRPAGRVFRAIAGLAFLSVGYMFRGHALGIVSMAWGALALIAGGFDVCFMSALLGGPLSGAKIRAGHKNG